MEILSSMMTVAVSMATSSLAAALVTFRLNESKDQRFFLRQKIEEVYLCFHKFSMNLTTHYLAFMPVILEKYDYNTALDMVIKSGEKAEKSLVETVDMNINIYFPELVDEFSRFLKIRDEGNGILTDFTNDYKIGKRGGRSYYALMAAVINKIDVAEKEFNERLIALARELSSRRCELKIFDFLKFKNGNSK